MSIAGGGRSCTGISSSPDRNPSAPDTNAPPPHRKTRSGAPPPCARWAAKLTRMSRARRGAVAGSPSVPTRERPREHRLAALENEHVARLGPELDDGDRVGLGQRCDEGNERAQHERADPHALRLVRVGPLHEVDAGAHVLESRHGRDDRKLAVLGAGRGGASRRRRCRGRTGPARRARRRARRPAASGPCPGGASGESPRASRRWPSPTASGPRGSPRPAPGRRRSEPPRRRCRWRPRRPTRRGRARSCGTQNRTRATFTLALPMSMPSQVGMPLALLSAHSMLK